MRWARAALAAAVLASPRIVAADQAVTLARDIVTTTPPYYDASVGPLTTVGDVAYFQGPAYAGSTLWRSDGSPGGTHFLRNVDPRTFSFGIHSLTNAGGRLFFAASSPAGQELWTSDGTEAGTAPVADACPGPCNGMTEGPDRTLAAVGDDVYFAGYDGFSGVELWKSDGTAGGTLRVADVNAGGSSWPQSLTALGGRVLFSAVDGAHGRELWVSDGTPAGTVLAVDARPGLTSGVGDDPLLTPAGARAFFVANDGVHGAEPWVFDGTSAHLVADVRPGSLGSEPRAMAAVGGLLVFQVELATGPELWRSDGTAAGTFRLIDLGYGDLEYTSPLAVLGGFVLFMAGDAAHGVELWRTDGTVSGTTMVLDIAPGPTPSVPQELTRLGGLVYFSANDGVAGRELWVTDGTAAGTRQVADVDPGPGQSSAHSLTAGATLLYFLADTFEGRRLFRSDGTAAGTFELPTRPVASGSNPSSFVDRAGTAFFFADESGLHGLWRSDGTEGGTQRVKALAGGNPPEQLTVQGGRLFFTLDDGLHGLELWTSDGTEAGTQLLVDLVPGSNGSTPHSLTPFAGLLFFGASGGLYRTDGTPAGTELVSSVGVGPTVVHAGSLFFANGSSLWKSDGTPSGTVLVKQIDPSYAGIRELTSVGSQLFFLGNDGVNGTELWRSDGSEGGTVMVKDLVPGGGSPFDLSEPRLVGWNGVLYFVTNSGFNGAELWRSDGTEPGTLKVWDLWPYSTQGADAWTTVANGALYFFSNDGDHGLELWRSDGTPGQASLVADLWPGRGTPEPRELVEADGTLFFSAKSPAAGWELFRSDGTAAGTTLAGDIEPGSASAVPWALARVGDRIFMSATDEAHGREPWSLKLGRSVAIGDAAVAETNGATVAHLPVSLTSASSTPVTVTYATGGGTATPGVDYTPTAGTLTFAPGAVSATIDVPVLGDTADEENETFGVQLASADVLVADGQGEARILDDDPRPQIGIADCAALEGDAGTTPCSFAVTLTAASGRLVTADYATTSLTAAAPADFHAASGTVVFPPGQVGVTVAVDVVGDALHEGDETFRVDLDRYLNTAPADAAAVGLIQDDDAEGSARGELAHGTRARFPLAPTGDDAFRVAQGPFSSYEVVVDAVAGDGAPVVLRRLAADGVTVLQSSEPIGTGGASRVAWEHDEGVVDADQLLRASGACAPVCAAGTSYRLRAYDTTYAIPRFNNGGSQQTVVFVQNPGPRAVTGHVRFWDASGLLLATRPLALAPRGLLVLNAAGLPELAGASGSVTVTSDAGYGALQGKAVTIDPAGGLSFDAVMSPRPR